MRESKKAKRGKKNWPPVSPMGTFDHLIIAMGIHLAHIHGPDKVLIVSSDRRLTDVLAKCKSKIPAATKKRLRLDAVEDLTGRLFSPAAFPSHINLAQATRSQLAQVFGEWPLKVEKSRSHTVTPSDGGAPNHLL